MTILDAVGSTLTAALALVMVVWGWKVFRVVVALGSGVIVGSIAALISGVGFAAVGNSLDALKGAVLVAVIAFLAGFAVGVIAGVYLQQVAAALMAAAGVGGLAWLIGWMALGGPRSSGNEARVMAFGLAIPAAVFAVLLVIRLYDYFAAGFMAFLFASRFNSFGEGPGLWSILTEARSVSAAVLSLAAELGSSIWSRAAVAAWVVAFAVLLRAWGWTEPPDATLAGSLRMKPAWASAVLSTGAIALVGTACEHLCGARQGAVAGMYLIAWPAVVVGVVALHARLPAPPEVASGSAFGQRRSYLAHLLAGCAAIPLLSSVLAVLLSDVPRLALGRMDNLEVLRFLEGYYGGFAVPWWTTGGRALDLSSGVAWAAKWGTALVIVPLLLEWSRKAALSPAIPGLESVIPADTTEIVSPSVPADTPPVAPGEPEHPEHGSASDARGPRVAPAGRTLSGRDRFVLAAAAGGALLLIGGVVGVSKARSVASDDQGPEYGLEVNLPSGGLDQEENTTQPVAGPATPVQIERPGGEGLSGAPPTQAPAAGKPEGFPDEIPKARTRPPNVREWAGAETVKLEPSGCFRKVVREWMRLNCSRSKDENPGVVGLRTSSSLGNENADYFAWVRPPDVADLVLRMVPGRSGTASLQLESRTLTIGYDWSGRGEFPEPLWK